MVGRDIDVICYYVVEMFVGWGKSGCVLELWDGCIVECIVVDLVIWLLVWYFGLVNWFVICVYDSSIYC